MPSDLDLLSRRFTFKEAAERVGLTLKELTERAESLFQIPKSGRGKKEPTLSAHQIQRISEQIDAGMVKTTGRMEIVKDIIPRRQRHRSSQQS